MAVVSRQTGTTAITGAGVVSATRTITSVNAAKSTLRVTAVTDAAGGNMGPCLISATITSSTQITFTRESGSTPGVVVHWQVIEFDDSDINVQRGEVTAASYTTSNVAISSVSLTRASASAHKARNGTAWRDRIGVGVEITSSTNVRLTNTSGGTNTRTSWEVVEWPASASVQAGMTAITGTTATATITAVDMAKSFVDEGVIIASETNPNDDVWSANARLTSTTQVTCTRQTSNATATNVYWFVVELDGVSVQRGLETLTTETSVTPALTTVDPTKCMAILHGNPRHGGRGVSSSMNASNHLLSLTVAASTLTIARFDNTGTVEAAWEVVEFDVGGATYAELAGTPSGAGTATGGLTGVSDLASSATGAATASADLVGSSALASSASGAATASGDLTMASDLSASATGAATATADLAGTSDLASSATGAATASGDLTGNAALAGSATGAATAVGDLSIGAAAELAGTAAGAASAVGDLVGASDLAASATGAATATGALTGTSDLAASATGAATAVGDLTATSGGTAELAGVADGAGSGVGNLTGTSDLSASASGAATAAGDLTGTSALAASASGAATAAGNLITVIDLSGAITGAATATANLTGVSDLAVSALGSGTLIGDLALLVGLGGSASGVATAIANLLASSPQTSAIRGVTGASGDPSFARAFGSNGSRSVSGGTNGRTRANG